MLTKSKPKYKIGTLLRNKNAVKKGAPLLEQIMIVRAYVIMDPTTTHEGLIVESEVKMYDLMYLGQEGKRESQTERWLETLIRDKKIEVAATPN